MNGSVERCTCGAWKWIRHSCEVCKKLKVGR